MTAHIMCLTSTGGIPIFVRQKGKGEMISFSKMASLNGIHMYLKSQNIDLTSTDLPDASVIWKEYEKCITLIAIANGITKYVLNKFVDTVFGAMVLFVGIDEIKSSKGIERFKKDVRVSFPVIDRLLECLNMENKGFVRTDLINMTECIMTSENSLLQMCLEGYMECLESMYGCILVHGCLAAATDDWWSLSPVERKLLILAVTTEDSCTVRDVPVFLPQKSPNVAFRLVSVTLINHIEVLALCGPNPELLEIERLAVQCWKSAIEALRNSELCYPRNLSITISLDSGVLGFLLANHKIEKYVLGRNSQSTKNRITGTHQLDILRNFYHQAVETFMLPLEAEDTKQDKDNLKFRGVQETYWCSEYHKCHAAKDENHILCVLYTSVVPVHTMRLITRKTLKTLLLDKQIRWESNRSGTIEKGAVRSAPLRSTTNAPERSGAFGGGRAE